jgi:16S rRNA (cytosine1402-N4)-methyltransferase
MESPRHVPILVRPIVDALIEPLRALPADAPTHWLVDCTLGGGGHTEALLGALSAEPSLRRHRVLAADQDQSAIDRARERFRRELVEGRLELVHSRFGQLGPWLAERPTLGLLADLGFSSDQLDDPARGLSFRADGPLDMRLDPSGGPTARDLLSRLTESELRELIGERGEERFAGRIARELVRRRSEGSLPRTTVELAELVVRAVPPGARHSRIHPATRTFQALRIAVNCELEELDSLLDYVILSLKPGGRVAILSFHSLEDRKVKQRFKERGGPWRALTKKPIEADDAELARNPRSRSAKLRIAERI